MEGGVGYIVYRPIADEYNVMLSYDLYSYGW